MVDRNRRLKPKPEKFQLATAQFDLIITAEERVYDQVVECKYLNCLSISSTCMCNYQLSDLTLALIHRFYGVPNP